MLKSETLMGGDIPDVKVGIGCAEDSRFVEPSVRAMDSPNVIIYRDPVKMLDDLVSGKIDAALRGDMSSSDVLPLVKEKLGLRKLERVVLMSMNDRLLVTLPVGIDEGWSVDSRMSMTYYAIRLFAHLGLEKPRIAVMSGGRFSDRGRCERVDRSLDEAQETVKRLTAEGYDAFDTQILIEKAIDDQDIIIAPEGISGNMMFRCLHFIAGLDALGAPVMNADKVFVDTTREKTDYTDCILLAMKLAEMRKKEGGI